MRANDLKDKRVAIWGTGREGIAAADFIRSFIPGKSLTFIDEAGVEAQNLSSTETVIRDKEGIDALLKEVDVVVKSPGVSLYHPAIERLKLRNVPILSLLNLYLAQNYPAKTICVTGTKGKSTTATLIHLMLTASGKSSALYGNIGRALDAEAGNKYEYLVLEVSSYQAADMSGDCDLAVVTSLYPEHLDWHRTVEAYFKDKLKLITHSRGQIINAQTVPTAKELGYSLEGVTIANIPTGIFSNQGEVYDGDRLIGAIDNEYLSRPQNAINLCTALTVIKELGIDLDRALSAVQDFGGLPHRQKILGELAGRTYVDDSISTTPESAIAAMEVFKKRPISLIAGGYDRGIDYSGLADYIVENRIGSIVCLGPSGDRIAALLEHRNYSNVTRAASMPEAVQFARANSASGSVILLSPAAPSYGMFKDFIDRGKSFAREAGFEKLN